MVTEEHTITDPFYLNLNKYQKYGITNYMMYYLMDDESKNYDIFDVRNLKNHGKEKKYKPTKW